jgi:hypothetical protein
MMVLMMSATEQLNWRTTNIFWVAKHPCLLAVPPFKPAQRLEGRHDTTPVFLLRAGKL